MLEVDVFLTHDNTFSLKFSINSTPVDLVAAGVSRIVVSSDVDTIDSAVETSAFDYTTNGASGIVEFDFAGITGLALGKRDYDLTIFDVAHPTGQVWENAFKLHVNAARVS